MDDVILDKSHILVIGEPLHLQTHVQISHVENFTDQSQLSHIPFTAIIINTRDKQASEKISVNLRASSEAALTPIFTTTPTPYTDAITDGQIPDNLTLWLSTYDSRKAQLKLAPENLDEKLICYLWLHESRLLTPKKHITEAGVYHYPLIDLWDNSASKDIWLLALERDDILLPEKLVDRIRQCKHCHSAALNYIETCPSCSSIDIKQESAIHCFTCGHVEDQSLFMRQGKLTCPNCLTTLRHIGVDYDRPLENHRCNDCDTVFVDGKVKANCFSCGTSNELDALQQKYYYAYGLHDNGKIQAKTGELRQLLPSSVGETISREHFGWMVEWCNRIAVRHQQSHVLLVLSFTNLSELLLSQSEVKVMEHLDAFIQRLKGLLRETDVCCQFQPHCLFFLLPNTPESTITILNQKLNTLVDTQSDNSLELSVSMDALPNDALNEDVMLWLNQLYEKTINA
jgi:hypothetical protein